MSDTDLSSRIRQRREQLGLSQEELAARMGYRSKSSITKLEKGINDLPRAKLEELAACIFRWKSGNTAGGAIIDVYYDSKSI